jgi:hypothetical protein
MQTKIMKIFMISEIFDTLVKNFSDSMSDLAPDYSLSCPVAAAADHQLRIMATVMRY